LGKISPIFFANFLTIDVTIHLTIFELRSTTGQTPALVESPNGNIPHIFLSDPDGFAGTAKILEYQGIES
jgi:hypothetical protein